MPTSPSTPRATTSSAAPAHTSRSGVTRWTSSATGYAASIVLAWATASSIPPTRKNACSGRSAYSPSHRPLKDAIVSSIGTYFPGIPVKYVPIDETIASFKGLCEGEYDDLPEQAFFLVGGIEEAVAQAKTMEAA